MLRTCQVEPLSFSYRIRRGGLAWQNLEVEVLDPQEEASKILVSYAARIEKVMKLTSRIRRVEVERTPCICARPIMRCSMTGASDPGNWRSLWRKRFPTVAATLRQFVD